MPRVGVEPTADTAPPCILVAEDNILVRFAIADALRKHGICVVEAASADEAWDYLSTGATVHLVFAHHHMRGSMTGSQLADRISQEYPDLEVVITSGRFRPPESAAAVLDKPYDPVETAAALAYRNRQQEETHGTDCLRRIARRG